MWSILQGDPTCECTRVCVHVCVILPIVSRLAVFLSYQVIIS